MQVKEWYYFSKQEKKEIVKSKKTLVGLIALAILLVVGGLWMFQGDPGNGEEGDDDLALTANQTEGGRKPSGLRRVIDAVTGAKGQAADEDASDGSDDEDETPAEKALKRWEKIIETFYEESEEPENKGGGNGGGKGGDNAPGVGTTSPRVTLADQMRVRDAFRELSDDDKESEVHHAMNLLPDESVAVMYGVLFDKTQSEEIMDVIFSDILNRDEVIKNPMMRVIREDKDHPMYPEADRILEVVEDGVPDNDNE